MYHDPTQPTLGVPKYESPTQPGGQPRYRDSSSGLDLHSPPGENPAKTLTDREKALADSLSDSRIGRMALLAARAIWEAKNDVESSDSLHPVAPIPTTGRRPLRIPIPFLRPKIRLQTEEEKLASRIRRTYSSGAKGERRALREYRGLVRKWSRSVERNQKRQHNAERTVANMR